MKTDLEPCKTNLEGISKNVTDRRRVTTDLWDGGGGRGRNKGKTSLTRGHKWPFRRLEYVVCRILILYTLVCILFTLLSLTFFFIFLSVLFLPFVFLLFVFVPLSQIKAFCGRPWRLVKARPLNSFQVVQCLTYLCVKTIIVVFPWMSTAEDQFPIYYTVPSMKSK